MYLRAYEGLGKAAIKAMQRPKSTLPCPPVNGKERYLLKYEAHPAKEAARARCITLDDEVFLKNFIDNFVDRKYVVDRATGRIVRLELYFKAGRTKVFDSNEVYKIPVVFSSKGRLVLKKFYGDIDHFLMRTDGFIYPVKEGEISYRENHTYNLAGERTRMGIIARALKRLWDLGFLTAGFISIVAGYGQTMSALKGIRERTLDPSALKTLETL